MSLTSTYHIKKWNQIIDNTNILRPIFTFIPDESFLNYMANNKNPIQIIITETNVYDSRQYATCSSSVDFPTFGPNYYNTTNEYVMVLHSDFITYPLQNGKFMIDDSIRNGDQTTFSYENEIKNDPEDFQDEFFGEEVRENFDQVDKKQLQKLNIIIWIAVSLFIVAIFIFIFLCIYR